jgi:hypothetical protein
MICPNRSKNYLFETDNHTWAKKRKSPWCYAQRAFHYPANINFGVVQILKIIAAFLVV